MNASEDFDENLHELSLDGSEATLVTKKKKKKNKKKRCSTSTWIDPLPLEGMETILGYKFSDPKLLEEALTHPCCNQPVNYDRLEFLGDAVINWLIGKKLFLSYPDLGQDQLTLLRSANVDNKKFARISIHHELYRYLRYTNEAFTEQIEEFKKEIYGQCNSFIKGPKFLADIFESLVGAVFMDTNGSLDTVLEVFMSFLEPLISPEELQMHPKTELQEFCQKKGLTLKFNEEYWEHNRIINVLVDNCVVGTGYGSNKEIAQNNAAKAALENTTQIYLNPTTEATPDYNV